MKKLLFFAIFSTLLLAACGDSSTEENIGGDASNSENGSASTEATPEEEANEEAKEESNDINELIVDNENVKATLIKIIKKTDAIFGDSYEIIFDVENKRSDSIEVQARSISADGRMVDDALTSMSQEVAPGKAATATLTINNYEGYEFPELNSDFEMELHIFSWDDYEYEESHPVKVTF